METKCCFNGGPNDGATQLIPLPATCGHVTLVHVTQACIHRYVSAFAMGTINSAHSTVDFLHAPHLTTKRLHSVDHGAQ